MTHTHYIHITAAHFGASDIEPWWIAHDHPERPVDRWTVWSWNCDACMIHLIASAAVDGDRHAEEFTTHSFGATTVAETLTQARAWRAERGMRPL